MKTYSSNQIQLVSRPEGVPTRDNFTQKEVDIGGLDEGQFLVKNEWLSVDPYMRGRMNEGASYVEPFGLNEAMEGGCVGRVEVSRNDDFPDGSYVLANYGWRDRWISDGEGVTRINPELAEVKDYLSVLGLTGMTAYVGLLEVGVLEDGENVFISAASGAVGSVACQIAKLKGCHVVGSAGSPEKIKWLKDTVGIDEAFNYNEVDNISETLAKLSPDGIDVYFDNVGGDHLEGAIDQMNNFGRIVCCGMISLYNDKEPQPGPRNLFKLIGKRILMEGFIVRDYTDLQSEFQEKMAGWIKDGKIVWEETVTEGLENAPDAFLGLFEGENLGKSLVKLS